VLDKGFDLKSSKIIKQVDIIRIKDSKKKIIKDDIIDEDILEIYINEDKHFEMVFSMTNPQALAAGFLFTQGIIHNKADIINIIFHEDKKQCHIILDDNARKRLNTFKKKNQVKGSSGGTLLPKTAMALSFDPNKILAIHRDQIIPEKKYFHNLDRVFFFVFHKAVGIIKIKIKVRVIGCQYFCSFIP